MMNQPIRNYWSVGYETRVLPLVLTGSTSKYPLNKSSKVLEDAKRIVAISHRSPVSNAYTLDNNKLVTSSIYDSAFLNLKDKNGGEVIKMPLSNIGNRSGGDNHIWMLPPGIDIDLTDGKSNIEIFCPSGTITTASTNNEAFELVFYFEPDC